MEWKTSLLALMLGSSVLLAACGGEEAEEPAEAPAEEQPAEEPAEETTADAGETVYQQSCISCHGQNLEGGFGPALDTIGSKLSEEEILAVIKNGQGQMPPNIVEGEDAQAIAAWLAQKQ